MLFATVERKIYNKLSKLLSCCFDNGYIGKVINNKETAFNEEAKWYKALTLIELKKNDEAKTILKNIVKDEGFYKAKAIEKIKGLQ